MFARIRERGHSGTDRSLAYFEWSADVPLEKLSPNVASNPQLWAMANPSMGHMIPQEYVANEYASMFGDRGFCIERLGVGDWPNTAAGGLKIIDPDLWDLCADTGSTIETPSCFAFDITPDRSAASIAVAGLRSDGLPHVEVVEHRRGTRWLPERLAELKSRHRVRSVYCDAYGPAQSVVQDLTAAKVEPTLLNTKEMLQACGIFYDAVVDSQTLRHIGQAELDDAVMGATTRTVSDGWLWDRKSASVDLSPLVAATVALWGLKTGRTGPPKIISLL